MHLVELAEAFRGYGDFGHYTKIKKGVFFYIGNGKGYRQTHTSEYDFRKELIVSGVELL